MDVHEPPPPDLDSSPNCDSSPGEVETFPQPESSSRRLLPDEAAYRLYSNWLGLIPTLDEDYLGYMERSQGRLGRPIEMEAYQCKGKCSLSVSKDWDVQCLYSDFLIETSSTVWIKTLAEVLVIVLVNVRENVWTDTLASVRTGIPANAPVNFLVIVPAIVPTINPTNVSVTVPADVSATVPENVSMDASTIVPMDASTIVPMDASTIVPTDVSTVVPTDVSTIVPANVSTIILTNVSATVPKTILATIRLVFGTGPVARRWPRALPIVFCSRDAPHVLAGGNLDGSLTDATFGQRHNAAAGDSPWFYEPKYFIRKENVDRMEVRITAARKKPPRSYKSQVPESALDECEKSYEAADEKKEKTCGTKFDDMGLMALKFSIALIDHLFAHLPKEATVVVYYDIGCVLDRSLHKFDILPGSITSRLLFAISAMHAYGHQWACQLVYNPRLQDGLGLTEGEGTERVWSKFRMLIGVTRSSGRSRRIWILDRHADVVNSAARENLGGWIRGRLKNGVEARGSTADEDLSKIDISISELREQWSEQRAAQLAVRNHAPARLKRELDAVLTLQTELDSVHQYFHHVKKLISENSNPEAPRFLESLYRTHKETVGKVEELYSSLNVTDVFPEIQGLPLEFVRVLLMARDLKINIRKRAIGTFFEWDKLDRASGTKLHQQTRKAISRRTPALLTGIRKFNKYCADLKKLYEPAWNFPLPSQLPEELNALREDSSLLSDVWVTKVAPTTPQWLENPDVRTGIRAVLAKDRCREERRRLEREAENCCQWYGRELAATELAMRLSKNAAILFLLRQQKEDILLLQFRWRTPFVSNLRFQTQTSEALRLAEGLSGSSATVPIRWVRLNFQHDLEEDEGPPLEEVTEEACLAQDVLEVVSDHYSRDHEDTGCLPTGR
ncbi:hypothetical protein GSI_04787 [Ganoderma sinense ZZ0214-1]|uniref:Uncharacterized protein n=1 Tax=Ganoderma sinense ZZ0214-1 TaxID=1077348 RepID=A0A2G8SHT7_9APHY|nr:hypothetical protein GSI_04787 [Ganoderma sinense ZZ0214-1]